MNAPTGLRLVFRGLPALLGGGCASTGATFGSGVGDAFLEHPPYYAGSLPIPGEVETMRIGHLPVAYQRGASDVPFFDPSGTEPMTELLGRMTAYLDSLGVSVRFVEGEDVSTVSPRAARVAPDVQFGCMTDSGAPDDDCAVDDESALGGENRRLRLAVGRPSAEWTEWIGRVMDDSSADRTLVVTLEVGQHLPRQRGWRGTKEIELGTSHVEELPWLTSLETPLSVLQLTGALVDRDGKAIRIGAEGLIARRTPITLSGFGAQALITQEDVERLMTQRRADLPGQPLVWQAGLRALVAQVTGHLTLLNG